MTSVENVDVYICSVVSVSDAVLPTIKTAFSCLERTLNTILAKFQEINLLAKAPGVTVN